MAKAPPRQSLTLADELREVLASCERELGKVRGSAQAALTVLSGLDRVYELLPTLEGFGVNLVGELTRLATLESQLRSKAAVVERSLRSRGGLAGARSMVQPDLTQWWWYLDEEVGAARRRRLRKLILALVAAAILITVSVVLYQRFLAPDPAVLMVSNLQFEAQQLASGGDYQSALAKLDEAQSLSGDNRELMLWRGVLLELTGQPMAAEELLTATQELFTSSLGFHLYLGEIYLGIGLSDQAYDAVGLALGEDRSSPRGLLLLGSVLETQGELVDAAEAYQVAYFAAEERGEAELAAIARVRLAYLMQRGSLP